MAKSPVDLSGGAENYLIGLDLGTSAVKGVLMSSKGVILAKERAQTRYLTSDNGFIEFDAEEFYMLAAGVIQKLVKTLPRGVAVAGLSMASASGNTVLADGEGNPLMNAISWMDKRVINETETIFGRMISRDIHEITGWPYINMFPLAHLCWLKCHNPELLQKAAKVCMSTDYINFRLTGEWGIDSSTATTSYLQCQQSAAWYMPYLERLGIPEAKLPPIRKTGTVLGHITPEASAVTGLSLGTPVVLGAFDHPCAARGSGVLDEGQMLLSCGTSWVGFFPLKNREMAVRQALLIDPFLQKEGLWGAMFSLGGVANYIDKYIRRYISGSPGRYIEFDRLASSSKAGAGGLLVNTMRYEETDELNNRPKEDIARAIMEGTVYLLRMRMEQLRNAGMRAESIKMVGGPSETAPWPQVAADILGTELEIVNGSCAGAVGAAIIAGIGAGLFTGEWDARNRMNFEKRFLAPDKKIHEEYNRYYEQFVEKYPVSNVI